ncbi:hypothetical protein AKO1_015858 [Acrasis kona]|uniref:Polysaccharide biosynthesis domain-containing protein n=1 Tax=Acrasis kona TaxID=1008807 RepID=A0AAW2ZJ28_9EUKA
MKLIHLFLCIFALSFCVLAYIAIVSFGRNDDNKTHNNKLDWTLQQFRSINKSHHCRIEFLDEINEFINGENPPQLNLPQLTWIASTVQTSAHTAWESKHRRHNFLVWGLGHDSAIWDNVNCVEVSSSPLISIGRTQFLENWKEWIGSVKEKLPHLEVQFFDQYQHTFGSPDKFFKSPSLLKLPSTIQNACWDVVLVDAPQGYEDNHPGRMESTYWSVDMAERCIVSGKLDTVHVFLHDVNRPLEKRIMNELLLKKGGAYLGIISGNLGDLVGFRFTNKSFYKKS